MLIEEYSRLIKPIDRLDDEYAVRLGLFGEIGSVLATAKKKEREGVLYDYSGAITEELGDAAWYFFRLVERLGYSIEDIFASEFATTEPFHYIATDSPRSPISQAAKVSLIESRELFHQLGVAAAEILKEGDDKDRQLQTLQQFIACYLRLVAEAGISFSDILSKNLEKTVGRFQLPDFSTLPRFDSNFDEDERLPDRFEIEVVERANGKTYLKWQGVFLGDPLTDNIEGGDGYRFHDVFHMSFAAILHWSPVFRSLIRHKRKSIPKFDEEQDGGRAIVIEEGLSAWIFSIAKNANYFEGKQWLSFDLLKGIQQFVAGYEVSVCPLAMWEKAILDGYGIFRELVKNKKGVIIGDRNERSIKFRA